MFRAALPLFALAILAACSAPVVVSDYNGDSVTIEGGSSTADSEAWAEARRICGRSGKVAEYASSRQIHAPQYLLPTYGHLYLCVNSSGNRAQDEFHAAPTGVITTARAGGYRY